MRVSVFVRVRVCACVRVRAVCMYVCERVCVRAHACLCVCARVRVSCVFEMACLSRMTLHQSIGEECTMSNNLQIGICITIM